MGESLNPFNSSDIVSSSTAADINLLASFLANSQIADLSKIPPTDCIVLCGSAILHCAETVFSALQAHPNLTNTLVICGGIGHSTQYLYAAIAQNPKYVHLTPEIQGLPESHVLDMISERFYDAAIIKNAGCKVIIEDASTNCGANAIETRGVLEANKIPTPKSIVIVQDPTMSLRTLAGFRKVYSDLSNPPQFMTCPTFMPEVQVVERTLDYATSGVDSAGLWEMRRFCDLVLGEIPRLRDDVDGYGPRGKGFIDHVDVPHKVDEAWRRLSNVMASGRTTLAN